MKKQLLLLLLLFSCLSWGQILTFDFSGIAGDETTATSNTNDLNLSTSAISRGTGLSASANLDRYNASNWAVSSISNAVAGNDYMEFTITPNTGHQFSVTSIVIKLQRSGTGLSAIALRNSLDNYSLNLDGEKSVTDNTNAQTFTFTFTQTNSITAVTYRLYGFSESISGTGGPGDSTGNDIVVNGVVTSTGPSITTSPLSGAPFCVGSGESASLPVPYTVSSDFTSGNVFTAQLSNASGSFATPTSIGTITSTAAGTISATIPSGTTSGSGYKIRVVSSIPVTTGSETAAFTINNFLAPTSLSASCGNATSSSTWTNPACFDEVLLVAKVGAFTSVLPTGNGSVYSANLTFGSGTAFDGGTVVYKGTGNSSSTITGLTNGITYTFKIFARRGNTWIEGGTSSCTASAPTPSVPSGLSKGCTTSTTQVLNWNAPSSGDFDGYILVVRENSVPNAVTSIVANSQSHNINYTLAPTYNSTTSRVLYIGNATTATITGLTPGINYTFALHTYNNNGATSLYSTATTSSQIINLVNVSSTGATVISQAANINWNLPTAGCFDQILAIITTTAGVTFSPTGDGSAYTANSVFASDNQVVYNGTGNTVSITGLTNGTTYYVEIFTRKGTEWSTGLEVAVTPTISTIFKPGELVFVGYDAQHKGVGSEDEYLVATFVPIVSGSSFSLMNSRYEAGAAANVRTDKWGGPGNVAESAPSILTLTYSGTTSIAAGSVLRIQTLDIFPYIEKIYVITGTIQTDITSSFTTSVFQTGNIPNIAAASPDQIFLMQGTISSDGTIDTGQANYILNGTLLHGLTNQIAWVSLSNACSGNTTTRESRLPASLKCFNVENTSSSAASSYYQNDDIRTGSIRQLIQGLGNTSNWTNSTGRYTVDASSSASNRAGKTFVVNAGNEPGTWVASSDTNWFNCSNWENLVVPDENIDVFINTTNSSVNNEINFNATDASLYSATAKCKNLNINGRKLILSGNNEDKIEVYGNLTIEGTGELDMSDNSASEDGQLYLYGNWTNNLSETSFKQGNSTIHFTGSTIQNVTCAGTDVEKFYNVVINNNLTTDNFQDKLLAEGDFTVNSDKTFTAKELDIVQVTNKVNTQGAIVTFENNSSLIQINDVANTGNITYKRIAPAIKGLDYVYWSSPVNGQDVSTIYTSPSQGPKYVWNTTANNTNGASGNQGQGLWQNASGTMDLAKGYIIRGSSNAAMTATDIPSQFVGVPRNGNISYTVSRGNYTGGNFNGSNGVQITKYDDNHNLLGNPYPSAIKASTFINANAFDAITNPTGQLLGTVKLWQHGSAPSNNYTNPFYSSFIYNYNINDYLIINSLGTVPYGGSENIKAGQAFFVTMVDGTTGSGNVNFNNAMRLDAGSPMSNSGFFRTANEESTEKSRIWLDLINAQNNTNLASIMVGYVNEATNGFDNLYDAITKLQPGDGLFSNLNDDLYLIQGRAPFTVLDQVPLTCKINTSGTYLLAIKSLDGLFLDNQDIFVKDNLLNTYHNLKVSPYTFTEPIGVNTTRFQIVYQNPLENTTPELEMINIYKNENTINVNAKEIIKSVKIIDLSGRVLVEKNNINQTKFTYNTEIFSQGVLIIQVTTEAGKVITKKVL
jgi:hypothetical protein